jgi:hypothetical protein
MGRWWMGESIVTGEGDRANDIGCAGRATETRSLIGGVAVSDGKTL